MKKQYFFITILVGLVAVASMLTSCLITVEIEGDYMAPESMRMSMVMEMNGEQSPAIEVVQIGENIYVKDPETQQWMTEEYVEEYEEYRGLEEFALSSIEFITAFKGTNMLSDEEINGIPCFHINGVINPAVIEDLPSDFTPTETDLMNAELWIDKENYLVRQMILELKIEETSPDTEIPMSGGGFSFTFQFSQFNEPINIEAPEILD